VSAGWRRGLEGVAMLLAVGVAVAWLSGGCGERIGPGVVGGPGEAAAGPVAPVERVLGPSIEWASGAVESARRTAVASRILARIEQVRVAAGSEVRQGDVLVVLDARDLEARVREAREALRGAAAALELARSEAARAERLVREGVQTQQRLEQRRSELRVAQAEVERRQQALSEAETAQSHARIESPVSGRVVDRLAEPGDTAVPGQPLLRIYDPSVLRVEAPVRESLAVHLEVGQAMTVEVPSLGASFAGVIDEIVPFADPGARTLLVKVRLPRDPRLFAGMYSRIGVPAGERARLLVPGSAIDRVGQLEFVRVATPEGVERRLVTTGRTQPDGRIEVLSGLDEGERVLADAGSAPAGSAQTPAPEPTTRARGEDRS
jgi:RND family efflux transporter MFP subunit